MTGCYRSIIVRGGLLLAAVLATGNRLEAQATAGPTDPELSTTIARLDSAVFHAFNACDVATFGTFFTPDLEFYHDLNGLIKGRQALLDGIAGECQGKRLGRRELVGDIEVHPMRGYGAIEIGVHRFFVRTAVGETPGSTARFVHLWRNDGGTWKVTRVLSFDHRR